MNVRTKTTLLLIITLLAGVLIGVFLSGNMMRLHMRRKLETRAPKRIFRERFEDIIQPRPEQKSAIDSIFNQHSRQIARLDSSIRMRFQANLDSLQADLNPILDPTQKERMEQAIKRMKEFQRKRGMHGPPERPPFKDDDRPPEHFRRRRPHPKPPEEE